MKSKYKRPWIMYELMEPRTGPKAGLTVLTKQELTTLINMQNLSTLLIYTIFENL